jgi:ubiquinone/menaquinone biosynthesis C-methylase UbiE
MNTPANATTLGGFNAVDAAPSAGEFVAALDEIAAFPAVQRLRAAAVELLAPRLGDRLVDVGCGTGDQVRALAAAVGPGGSVLGVDSSETMLAEARRRTP